MVAVGLNVAVGSAVSVAVGAFVADAVWLGVALAVSSGVSVYVDVTVLNGVTLAVAVSVGWAVGLANEVGVSVASAGPGVWLSVAVGVMGVTEASIATSAVGVARLSRLRALEPRHTKPDMRASPMDITNMRQPRCPAARRARQ
jgi:hypothetical protein